MDAADLDPSAPLCNCGSRGCVIPGHALAFVEFAPMFLRRRRRAMRHKRKR